jgi:hypothetical protein
VTAPAINRGRCHLGGNDPEPWMEPTVPRVPAVTGNDCGRNLPPARGNAGSALCSSSWLITQRVNILHVASDCQNSEIRTKRRCTGEHEVKGYRRPGADAMPTHPAVLRIP